MESPSREASQGIQGKVPPALQGLGIAGGVGADLSALLVYGYEPSGHSQAAAALGAALGASHSALLPRRVCVSKDFHPWLGPLLARAYFSILGRLPRFWDLAYGSPSARRMLCAMRAPYLALFKNKLRAALEAYNPSVLVCTHSSPFGMLAAYKERMGLSARLVGVLTDFGINSYWSCAGADIYCVATEEAGRDLEGWGIPKDRIRVTGIPVHPRFIESLIGRDEARAELGISSSAPVFLVTGGTRGMGRIAPAAAALRRSFPKAVVLAACGQNSVLEKSLAKQGSGLRAFSGLDEALMARLMSASDLLVGKAGGLTMAESLCAGLPAVFFEPLAGQEKRNVAFALRAGFALQSPTLGDLAGAAAAAMDPGRHSEMRAAAYFWARPHAAADILDAAMAGAKIAAIP